MMVDLVKRHLPEWIEAGVIVMTLVVGAVISAGITFYKVDQMSDDVKEIKIALSMVPVLVNRIENVEKDIEQLESKVDVLDKRVYELGTGE